MTSSPLATADFLTLTDEQRTELRELALKQIQAAGAAAVAKFVDGQLTVEELEEVLATLTRGAAFVGEYLIDVLIQLPEPYETAVDTTAQYVFEKAASKLADLIGKFVRWVDDMIGPNARRLLRRIDELERDDLTDGVVGDDKPRKMYRLCERLVRRFPAAAVEGGVAFDGLQLVIDGVAWGEPPEGFRLKAA